MPTSTGSSYPKPVPTVLLAWFLCLGADLFLHGGLLARFYAASSPFLLVAEAAFRRIPFGYVAILVLVGGLFWLCRRLNVRGVRSGWWHGFVAGIVVWGGLALGLYSITTAGGRLLAGWWLGQAVELGLAGAAMGALASGVPLWRAWLWVVAAVIALIALTVALQTMGLAPAARVATT